MKPEDSSPPEIAKSEIAKPENPKPEILATEIPAQSETAPAQSATALGEVRPNVPHASGGLLPEDLENLKFELRWMF